MATRTVYPFNTTKWTPGTPITQEYMNQIENELNILSQQAVDDEDDIGALERDLGQVREQAATAFSTAQGASTAAQNATTASADGTNAWNQLVGAGVVLDQGDVPGTSLANLFEHINDLLNPLVEQPNGIIPTLQGTIQGINTLLTNLKTSASNNQTYSSIGARLEDTEGRFNTLNQNFNTLTGETGAYNTLANRLNAIDGQQTISINLPTLITEIVNARGGAGSLSANLATLVKIADIQDNVTSNDSTKPLSAYQGKVLKGLIKDIQDGTVTEVNNAIGNANYGDTSLEERFRNIDGDTVPARTLPSVITELQNARKQTGVDQSNQPVYQYGNLTQRFTDIDGKISHVVGNSGQNDKGGLTERIEELENATAGYTNDSTVADAISDINNKIGGSYTSVSTVDAAINSKVAKADIQKNLTHSTNDDKVLQARQGYLLDQKISHVKDENDANDKGGLEQRMDSAEYEISHNPEGNDETYGLKERMTSVEDTLGSDVLTSQTILTNNAATTYQTVDARLEAIETAHAGLDSALDTRIDSIDGGSTPIRTLPNLITEVENARKSTVKGTEDETTHEITPLSYDNLDLRLEAIETDIDTIATDLAMYDQTGAIVETNTRLDTIEDNVIQMGKEIGMLQDGATLETWNAALTRNNTKIDKIEDELGNARIQIGEDENNNPIMSTLDQRLDGIDSGISTINNTLGNGFNTTDNTVAQVIAAAITTAESYTDTQNVANKVAQIDEANRAHSGHFVEDEETHEQVEVEDTLDLRFDDIEDRLDAIDTAGTGALDVLDGRVDNIEDELTNARVQIGTDDITGDPIYSTLDSRFDSIENAISHAEDIANNDAGGLTERMTAAEAAIATKASSQALGNLSDAVSAISTTIVLTSNQVNFDEDNHPTTLKSGSIVDKNDYLIQDPEDEKYYYWKHINNEWHLMGGAGGGGTGTSSAVITDTLPAVADADLNTDYYVGTPTTGYTHYRFNTVYNEDLGQDVVNAYVIGQSVDTSKIKRYNMEKIYDENAKKHYLKFYQYDYDANNNEVDTDLSNILPWVASTSYAVNDKVLYTDGYVYNCNTANSDEEWTISKWTKVSNINTIQMIELPEGGGGGASTGVVKRLTRIGDQSIETITGSQILLRVFYAYHTTTLDENNNVIPEESSAGSYVLTCGNRTINTGTISSGAYKASVTDYQNDTPGYMQFDVTEYCNIGNNSFTLVVTTNGETQTKSWSIKVVDLRLETNAPNTLLIEAGSEYEFPYTPFGALTKKLHVKIDGVEIGTGTTLVSTTSGRAAYYTIPPQSHGTHTVEMYLDAEIGGFKQTTESIVRQYIWYDVEDELVTTILSSPYYYTTTGYVSSWSEWAANTAYAVGAKVKRTTNGIPVGYICITANNDAEFVATNWKAQIITVRQYETVQIPYQVYKKDADSIEVSYYADSSVSPYETVVLEETTQGTLTYLASTDGAHTLTLRVDDVSMVFNIYVSQLDINVSPVAGAIIDFDPTTLTNSSANRLPSWNVGGTTYRFTASDNFNWSNDVSGGGYKTDKDGKCFVIKAGSYIDLDYPLFQRGLHTPQNANSTVFDRGAEMKIIFKVEAVRDINAVWFTNTGTVTEKTVGIQLGAHSGWLKTTKATNESVAIEPDENGVITINGVSYNVWKANTLYPLDSIVVYKDTVYKCIAEHTSGESILNSKGKIDESKWLATGKIDTGVLATNSYLYMPYSESDKIELDININQYDSAQKNNFIMSYEDGVPSKVYSYTYGAGGDGLYHNNTIRIGSNDCDVYIYHLRVYNQSLDTDDILQNFIADGRDINEKVERYNRNCIYWDSTQEKYFISPSQTAILDPVKLAERMPNVKVLMLDAPTFTLNKKSFIKDSSLRCIHARGEEGVEYDYPSRGDADNWLFINGFHSGQGTTSDNYGQSGRNVDFLFEVDGVHWPTKKKNMSGYTPSLDYKSAVYVGENASVWDGTSWSPAEDVEGDECQDWKGDDCKISLTQTSVPNNYFNLKVNVASSENVNNALFQKRYDDFIAQAYTSPATAAQKAKHGNNYPNLNDIKVKNSMEFVPAVLFIRENDPDLSKHSEFNDTNWHFYALGNIGDSKKTDYTRAYDPDDMNEFTCENSDNNTNNGQFQSGVFNYLGNRAIETPFKSFDSTTAYKNGDKIVSNGKIYIRTGADQEEGAAWDSSDWTEAVLGNWTDEGTPYFAPYTAPNPMEYVYPITPSEWNVTVGGDLVNYKHYTLLNEGFDGDHSFEFRYGCRGDYRDGDPINDTSEPTGWTDDQGNLLLNDEGEPLTYNDVQFELNRHVIFALYEWLITSTEEQYAAEAPLWFVKPAMEFFYAYTHYYTMMDNRAKNTFWHFAKTATRRAVPIGRAFPELMHVYEEDDGNGGYQPATGDFDNTKQYYTSYAFDLWAYDMDTAAGIDNNGALVFPYGKEDTDYRTEGDPASGYAFNGAGSIFWRRLRTTFASEIVDIMNSSDINCFNSQNLIDEFDRFQNCFPEEVWRLDIERKYVRTFTGLSVDNSITTGKQNPRFLTSMMQGRKKYQRRQWIRDQGVYFNSKYRLTDIIANENMIEFNCTTPAIATWEANTAYTVGTKVYYAPETGTGEVNRKVYRCITANRDAAFDDAKWVEDVTPTYHLSLTPFQDMYLNVAVGNGNYQPQIRAKAGQEYIFDITGSYQETRIYIAGANHLSGIGNLAPMYPYAFDLRALAHIKVLDIGTNDSGYVNTKFTELVLPNYAPLLETLNIKNCHSIASTINLSEANNIRAVYAEGTVIAGITLPDYTSIQTLHIPQTMTEVKLYGARFLTDFKVFNNAGNVDYGALYKLHIYDSDYSASVDWMQIASDMLAKQSLETEIEMLKLNVASIGDIQDLAEFSDFKQPLELAGGIINFTGTLHVNGVWSEVERDSYAGLPTSIWPNLTLDTSNGTLQVKHRVDYVEENARDGTGNLIKSKILKTLYINDGDTAPDIYAIGLITKPTKSPTAESIYDFGSINELTDRYITYSGWTIENSGVALTSAPIIQNDAVLVTYFTRSDHMYYIRWYLNEGDSTPVYQSTAKVAYGGGYDIEAPTVAYIHSQGKQTCTVNITGGTVEYHIFTGWQKLPTNINPSADSDYYDIYGEWEVNTTTIPQMFASNNIENLTPEQLLALSAMNAQVKIAYAQYIGNQIAVGTRMTYPLGYDGPPRNNTTQIVPVGGQVLRLDAGDDPISTNISPLSAGNDSFTFAIDYCLDPDATYNVSTSYAILAGCYYNGNGVTNGFAVYLDVETNEIKIGFGDMFNANNSYSKCIGTISTLGYRNILVIRHEAGKENLNIYSGFNSSQNLPESIYSDVITYPYNFNSDAKLYIGALASGSTGITSMTESAKGTIYWAKYWPEDLGAGECKRLASWPHESITYVISSIANGASTRTSSTPTASLSLVSLNTSNHGTILQPKVSSAGASWSTSMARRICNERIFNSLPIKLQSIMWKSTVYTRPINYISSQDVYTQALGTVETTQDYLYAYSAANVVSTSNNYGAEGSQFAWYVADSNDDGYNDNIDCYNYNGSKWVSTGASSYYLGIRFPNKAIKWGVSSANKLRVFVASAGSTPTTNIAASINSAVDGGIRSGDIYVEGDNAYMYVYRTEVATLGLQVKSSSEDARFGISNNIDSDKRGSWIIADDYWTRSLIPNQSAVGTNFVFVKKIGSVDMSTVGNSSSRRKLSYIIAL